MVVRKAALPVADTAALANRKKHRGLRSASSEQGDNVFDRVTFTRQQSYFMRK
jgi:hypothetical protein